MTISVRAIFEKGRLRLLEPVELAEGQEIEVMILTEREHAIAALGDLFVEFPVLDNEDIDEQALLRELDETYQGPPISEAIIEERRKGP